MTEGKPEWLRVRAPVGEGFGKVRELSRTCGLRTVCDDAQCPNISECWSRGHATFLIMGPSCTRSCRFCAIEHGGPSPLDPSEPERVGRAVRTLGLRHAVITSVTRDDLPDHGAGHFARVVEEVRRQSPGARVELLIPDMEASTDLLSVVVSSGPDIIGHNLETVRRLQPEVRDRRCSYERSLETLAKVKMLDPPMITKSSLMLGLGEAEDEVLASLDDLRRSDVDAITMGQYLRPRGGPLEVSEYILPGAFERLGAAARRKGFRSVASAPLVRSSFHAPELFDRMEE